MANRLDKNINNCEGDFYADKTCVATDCLICCMNAPYSFTNGGGQAWCYAQPATKEDTIRCREVMATCPLKCIGEDGMVPPPPPSPTYASEVLDGVTYASNQ